MALSYRPEIDGLRALAVLLVVLFHAGVAIFPGGFIGVDVFFVISGYLISSILIRELAESGRIGFRNFYLRRVRRLGPALLSTIFFSFILAFLLFSRSLFSDFSASAIAAIASLSNVWFWLEADYFDTAAVTKPLLHTWSLSVEEQFYLIWPILMIGLFKIGKVSAIGFGLLGLAFISLIFAEAQIGFDLSGAYYLLPARVVEFAMGAGLYWLRLPTQRPPWIDDLLIAIGLVLIIASAMLLNEQSHFPGLVALVPCLGASLIILCTQSRRVVRLLNNPLSVLTGKISYSLYLVHWPIIVFLYSNSFETPTPLRVS